MLALALASRRALLISHDWNLPRDIVIYSDSSSTLSNITLPGPNPARLFSLIFIKNIKEALSNSTCSISLRWSPGHTKVQGNELTDTLAKEASLLPCSCQVRAPTQAFLSLESKVTVPMSWGKQVKALKPTPGTGFLQPTHFDELGNATPTPHLAYPSCNNPTEVFKETP
jgi:hypothetical protein